MALMTMIARVVDGLPLVGTMQDDEQVTNFHFCSPDLIVTIYKPHIVWQKLPRISKSSENVIPQNRSTLTAKMFN